MSKEAMQMALDALEQITPDWRTSIDKHEQLNNSIEALSSCLAQPEPVAWFAFADQNGPLPLELYGWDEKACKHAVLTNARAIGWKGTVEGYLTQQGWTLRPLYTAPPRREWVGLTDEEISGCINATAPLDKGQFLVEFSKSIEAKLKDKNGE